MNYAVLHRPLKTEKLIKTFMKKLLRGIKTDYFTYLDTNRPLSFTIAQNPNLVKFNCLCRLWRDGVHRTHFNDFCLYS